MLMMLPVRYLVQRKMKGYAEKNILFSLSVVHAQSRITLNYIFIQIL